MKTYMTCGACVKPVLRSLNRQYRRPSQALQLPGSSGRSPIIRGESGEDQSIIAFGPRVYCDHRGALAALVPLVSSSRTPVRHSR